MNRFVKIILISNLVTIVVTAAAVLAALHYGGDATTTLSSSSLNSLSSMSSAGHTKNRFLQEEDAEPCCDCTTGEVVEDEEPEEVPLFCFSASTSRVRVLLSPLETKEILMKDLKLGQQVYVGNGNYEPIYSFGHYNNNPKANNNKKMEGSFLRLFYYDENQNNNNFIDLTKNHMVYRMNTNTFVAASFLKVGDTLQLDKNDSSSKTVITSIRSIPIPKDGYMAPFTPSGQLVVNDIIVSSFVDLLEGVPTTFFKMVLTTMYYSPQWIAHAFEFPHRLACHYYNICKEETYDENGISNWVSTPLKLSQSWISSSSSSLFLALQIPMMAIFGMILILFTITEQVLLEENNLMTMMAFAVMTVLTFTLYGHKKKEINY